MNILPFNRLKLTTANKSLNTWPLLQSIFYM